MRAFEGQRAVLREPPKAKHPSLGQIRASSSRPAAAECYYWATVPREPACPIANSATSRPASADGKQSGETESTNARSAAAAQHKLSSDAQTAMLQSFGKLPSAGECITDLIMTRFAAVKHQRTVALAEDMNAAADEIVKIRSRAQREKRDPAALRAEELKIREKFGLLEDTPLWDVTTRGSPRL